MSKSEAYQGNHYIALLSFFSPTALIANGMSKSEAYQGGLYIALL
jgi:hypothetical protein